MTIEESLKKRGFTPEEAIRAAWRHCPLPLTADAPAVRLPVPLALPARCVWTEELEPVFHAADFVRETGRQDGVPSFRIVGRIPGVEGVEVIVDGPHPI